MGLSIEAVVYLLHINFTGVHLGLLKLMFNGTRAEMMVGLKMRTVAGTHTVFSA